MADETLKRLLDAEAKAEQVIARADGERQAIVEQARQEATAAEQHHAKRVAEIHAAFQTEAEQRAQQTITELQRRYAEHTLALRASAEQREVEALDEALTLLTGTVKS
jgi:vacuolar-type H+-ATPase subunit H